MRQTFWDKLKEFSPVTCRLLARTVTHRGGARAMTNAEISNLSGLSIAEVNAISMLTTWDRVPLFKIRAFTEACGIRLCDRNSFRSQCAYMRRGPTFEYLKSSPDWETFFKPLILAYVSTRS